MWAVGESPCHRLPTFDHPTDDGLSYSQSKDLSAWAVQRVSDQFNAWIKQALFDRSMWLYLVDEFTGLPVAFDPAGTYPIEIKKPKESLRTFVPLMTLGIAAMYAHNGVAGIAQLRAKGAVEPHIHGGKLPQHVACRQLRVAF